MQEFWGGFEFIALAILFVLQIYFLIIALRKMKMMGDFFPDIKSIHIKRVALDDKGNEIKILSERENEKGHNNSYTLSESGNSDMRVEENKSKKSSTPSVTEMRNMKVEDLRPYVKYIGQAQWSSTAYRYCMRPEHIVEPKDAIVSINPSHNTYSDFFPTKMYRVEEFERIMAKPNAYASMLYDVIRSKTSSSPAEIKVLESGRCVEDGTKWKVVSKCKISI